MSFEKEKLSDYVEFNEPCVVNLGDNQSILAYGKGTYHVTAELDGHDQPISLRDVLYLPERDVLYLPEELLNVLLNHLN
jgi:hypothetical protein